MLFEERSCGSVSHDRLAIDRLLPVSIVWFCVLNVPKFLFKNFIYILILVNHRQQLSSFLFSSFKQQVLRCLIRKDPQQSNTLNNNAQKRDSKQYLPKRFTAYIVIHLLEAVIDKEGKCHAHTDHKLTKRTHRACKLSRWYLLDQQGAKRSKWPYTVPLD